MRHMLFAALLLSGCTSLPPVEAGRPEIRLLIARAEADLRAMLSDLSAPAAIPVAAASVDRASIAVALGAANGIDPQLVGLGVALRLCAAGIDQLEARAATAEGAGAYADGPFMALCLLPLSVAQAVS